jgi:hypothetical protein
MMNESLDTDGKSCLKLKSVSNTEFTEGTEKRKKRNKKKRKEKRRKEKNAPRRFNAIGRRG